MYVGMNIHHGKEGNMTEHCPTCGRPFRGKGRNILIGSLIGAVGGILLGHLFVVYYFGGNYSHPMSIIHYAAGAILGGLIGITVAYITRR